MDYKRSFGTPMAYVANHLGLLDAYSFMRRGLLQAGAGILIYHQVGECGKYPLPFSPISADEFENQLRYLCRKYEVAPLSGLVQCIQEGKPLPKKAVAITFDDGYKDNYLNAYPVLKKYNVWGGPHH